MNGEGKGHPWCDAPPHSLKESNVNPKVEIVEGVGESRNSRKWDSHDFKGP